MAPGPSTHGEPPLHVSLDLGAQPQDQPAARRRLEVPGRVRDDGGAPGKGHRDRGAEADAARVLGRQREREERLVPVSAVQSPSKPRSSASRASAGTSPRFSIARVTSTFTDASCGPAR